VHLEFHLGTWFVLERGKSEVFLCSLERDGGGEI
jgi:hypothetical protein